MSNSNGQMQSSSTSASSGPHSASDSKSSSFDTTWTQDSWYCAGPFQLPTPVSPISSMSRSPTASQTYANITHSSDLHSHPLSRSFGTYKIDPHEPRSVQHQTQRLTSALDVPLDTVPASQYAAAHSFQPHSSTQAQSLSLNPLKHLPTSNSTSSSTTLHQSPLFSQSQPASSAPTATHSSQDSPATSQQSNKGRKVKAHVQSACYNCKRAHLSCDPGRPCQRCLGSGKQDTCFDVAHKKRGRPRLRDNPKTCAARSRSLHNSTYNLNGVPSNHQYDGYGSFLPRQTTQGNYLPASFQTGFDTRYAVHPVAFLTLDLSIIRTNQMFSRIFGTLDQLRGKTLESIVHVADRSSLQILKMRLREEKDSRNLGILPPLSNTHDADAIPAVDAVDYQRLTADFQDRSQSLWFHYASGQLQQLNVQVRLAKSNIYFVVLVLPLFTEPLPMNLPMYQQFGSLASTGSMVPYGANFTSSAMGSYTPFAPSQNHLTTLGSQQRPSPPPSATQSPLYTYQPIGSLTPPTMQATPRTAYDTSYFSSSSLQPTYQSNYGYGATLGSQPFSASDQRSTQAYYQHDATTSQNVQLPPLSSHQQSQRMLTTNGLMSSGNGVPATNNSNGQYFPSQSVHKTIWSDDDDQEQGSR